MLQTVQKKQQTIYIWTDSAKKNCTGAFTVLQTVQKKTTTTAKKQQQHIYIWTDSAKKLHWSIYSAPDSAKKTTTTAKKQQQHIYIWTDSAKKLHWSIYSAPDSAKKQQQFTYGQYIFTDCTDLQSRHIYFYYSDINVSIEVENVCLTTTDYAHWFKTACG